MTHLETERLTLRPYEPQDEADYVRMVSDIEVMQYLPAGRTMGEEEAKATFARRLHGADPQRRTFALVETATGALVGWAGLMLLEGTGQTELYFGLRRDAWGRGLATEAAARMLRHGFDDAGFPRIVAVADPANTRAHRVLERIGMRPVVTEAHYGRMMQVYAATPALPPVSYAPALAPVVDPLPAPASAPSPTGFCTGCGTAFAPGARFCSGCGRPAFVAPVVLTPVAPPAAQAPPRVSQGTAVLALILNLFLPGVGSLVAGHRSGWPQLALFFGSFVLLVGTLFIGFPISFAMGVGAWIWALVTSIQILQVAT